MCHKPYEYFVWAYGSDLCLCRRCVHKRPSAYLGNIDPIDINKEQDIIHEEINEQTEKDFPRAERKGNQPFRKVTKEPVPHVRYRKTKRHTR